MCFCCGWGRYCCCNFLVGEEGWAYREKSTTTAQKKQEKAESKKKVGHIEKSLPLLPRKNKKKQKVRKKVGHIEKS